jgi:tRNA pseudouridine55 synthase
MNVRSGFLVLDKEEGITSHDLISRARRTLKTKKIGHAGTLDPMATGIMVLGVESATRLLDYVMAGKKRYLATIKLGARTLSDDRMSDVIKRLPIDIDASLEKLREMVGVIEQIPSAVSAIKVDGKRSYDRVRSGESVTLKSRRVEIFSINLIAKRDDELDIDVTCSAGTYIRAIARDIGGYLTSLRRIESMPFMLADAGEISLDSILPAEKVIRRVLSAYEANETERHEISLGRSIDFDRSRFNVSVGAREDVIAVISETKDVIALGKASEGRLQPTVVLPECKMSGK